jgi:diguanylate cyclase (GGDEF)-like protein
MLNLLRYSQLVALAVIVAIVVALSLLYRGLLFQSMVEAETHANVALSKAFANAVWGSHASFVARAGSLDRATLPGRAEVADLDRDLRRLSDGLPVVKVKIYDLNGLTVYSTDPRQIGQSAAANPGFLRARDGYPASNLTFRSRLDSWEGEIADRHILATYAPVHVYDAAPVEAVLEIYSDVSPLVEAAEASQWKIIAAVLGAMALVYAFVLRILWRYERLLREQERERAAQEERIRHQAYHDPLTGLPNRASFTEHLDGAMRRAKRAAWPLALLFLDLDLFKRVNDSLGHDAGDRLLRVAAERIRRAVREADMLFRMGGDEFTVLLEDVRGPEEAALVSSRVLESMAEPLSVGHHEIAVTASIGIALYPRDDTVGERLVKSADTAMYRAKELGRNRYAFFAREMNERVESQMTMEAALRRALKNDEFVLHFQPRVSAVTGRATGAEALLRWRHPEWGLIEPARFVPLLEETGLIVPVGAWVLAEACRQARAWQAAGVAPLRVSVNLSSRQFRSEALADAVSEALRASGLPPALLEIELTESLLVENVEHAMGVMGKLKAIGSAISIDDFGTGYSSLGYLKRFPIDSLKIDKSFVRDIATSPKDAAIVKAISALARSLGIGLIAEGVEEPWQVEFLRQRHCTEMQGYLFSRPLPVELLADALARVFPMPPASAARASIHSTESLRQLIT